MIINFLKICFTCTQRAVNFKFVVQQHNYLLEGLSSDCLKFNHATIENPASDALTNTCLEICRLKFLNMSLNTVKLQLKKKRRNTPSLLWIW